MDGTAATQAVRRELERLLEETELLLTHASGDARATAAPGAPAPTREAAASVTALRAAIDSGRPTESLEPDFFVARAAIADAAKPATPTGLAAHRDGLAHAAYEELAWAGHMLFAALTTFFVAFSLLTRDLDVISGFNGQIEQLVQQALPAREVGQCGRVADINYKVNTLKERAAVAYNEASTMTRWMSLFMAANGPEYRVTIERYPLELKPTAGRDGCEPASPTPAAQQAACDALPAAPAPAPNIDCNFEPVEQAARKAHWIYGGVLLPMLFGAYGATANARRRALSRMRDRTLTPQLARSYWLRIGLAAFAGAFMSQVIAAQLGDKLLLQLSPFVLAFLVGYKLPDLLAWIDGRFLPPPKR